jgi:carbamoyltransferase
MLNRTISQSGLYKRMFVHPASNDAGCSIGSIFEFCRSQEVKITSAEDSPFSPFLGPSFTDKTIGSITQTSNVRSVDLEEAQLSEVVANDLVNERLVGIFRGRAELGPRALGNRSIIANPCNGDNLRRVNRIKGREVWRPLTPSILEEYFEEVFEDDCANNLCEYMLTTATVKEDWLQKIPAVVHVDGTSRPQIVGGSNRSFHGLISKFHEKTEIPLVVNTSLDLRHEPIVNSPAEAITMLTSGKIDML